MPPRLLLAAAVLLAFGASVTHGFHFDDYSVISGAPWAAWQTRPLTWLSFEANAKLFSPPAFWHAVNLSTHLLAALLAYIVMLRFSGPDAALLGALIFAVHPIQAESVAYIYSRSGLFSAALSLAAALVWWKGRHWVGVLLFAVALLAKEDCATVPLVLLAVALSSGPAELPNIRRRKFASLATMLMLALAAAAHTALATHTIANSRAGFAAGISPIDYLLKQGYVILRYVRLTVIPFGFTIDPDIRIGAAGALACWLLLAAVCVIALLPGFRTKAGAWFGIGLLLLAPSSSIFPLGDLAADHRMYLPMVAFAGCAGILLTKLPRIAGYTVVAILILVSAGRMTVWGSEEKLWSEAVTRSPRLLRPRIQLSRALDPPRALETLRAAQALYPDSIEVDNEFGRVYLQAGRPELALASFGKVLGQRPSDAHAVNNRGVALRALGQEEAARVDFARALKLVPCLEEARRNLGLPACGK